MKYQFSYLAFLLKHQVEAFKISIYSHSVTQFLSLDNNVPNYECIQNNGSKKPLQVTTALTVTIKCVLLRSKLHLTEKQDKVVAVCFQLK